MTAMVGGARYPTIADNQLRVASNQTRHEAGWDQSVREKRDERECRETLPNRLTKNLGPATAHTTAVCIAHREPGKRHENGKTGSSPR